MAEPIHVLQKLTCKMAMSNLVYRFNFHIFKCLPKHLSPPHITACCLLGQSAPPLAGGGLLHNRSLSLNPYPHVRLHELQAPHEPKPPSTKQEETALIKKLYHLW